MALGTALANLLGIANLDQHIVKDTKLLMSGIKMIKSQFTCFLGSEDGSSQGLLLQRLNLWQNSTLVYPAIDKTQELASTKLLTTIIGEATKLKSMLCQCYFDIINKISTLEVPSDKDEVLTLAINEANKSSNSIIERTEQWFDLVKIKLAEVSHVINIDDLATGMEAPPGAATFSVISTEASCSTPATVPPAAPLVSGGKYNPLTHAPALWSGGALLLLFTLGSKLGKTSGKSTGWETQKVRCKCLI